MICTILQILRSVCTEVNLGVASWHDVIIIIYRYPEYSVPGMSNAAGTRKLGALLCTIHLVPGTSYEVRSSRVQQYSTQYYVG